MLKAFKRLMMAGCAVLAIGIAGSAQAQYVGPGPGVGLTTVAEVLKNPVDDQRVMLRGNIIRHLGSDHYEFRDDTGVIRMEIDDKHFRNVRITDTTTVEIYGEVDKDIMQAPEIDVKGMTVIAP